MGDPVVAGQARRALGSSTNSWPRVKTRLLRSMAIARCSAGLPTRNVALDFGCGVGRLSRALATRYASVIGVDIASTMIARARELNADRANIRFVENAEADLRFVGDGTVDFVYSAITLHHIPAVLQRAYIAEFMRVLAPEGPPHQELPREGEELRLGSAGRTGAVRRPVQQEAADERPDQGRREERP